MFAHDKYISAPQAAAMLGISANGMRRLLDEGVIPSIRPVCHRRVKVSAVQRRRCLEAFDEMDVQLTETRRRVCRAEAVLSQMRQYERCGAERFQGVN